MARRQTNSECPHLMILTRIRYDSASKKGIFIAFPPNQAPFYPADCFTFVS